MSLKTRGLAILLLMLWTAALAWLSTPRTEVAVGSVVLGTMVPDQFGAWKQEPSSIAQVSTEVARTDGTEVDQPVYDEVLMRTYRRDTDGAEVMLALAYGRRQRQEFKIHRPELCYYGHGYEVTLIGTRAIALAPSILVDSRILMTRSRTRLEPVTYWIRIGNQVSQSAWQTRWAILMAGVHGVIPDGLLVRVSSLIQSDAQSEQALEMQRSFLTDLYSALSPHARKVMAGV